MWGRFLFCRGQVFRNTTVVVSGFRAQSQQIEETTPTPNKNGAYGIKVGGFVCHKSRSSYAMKVGLCTMFSVKVPLFQGIFTPYVRDPNPNFLVRIFSGGVGVFHVKAWGPKSSVCPSKPRETKLFGGQPRILPGSLGVLGSEGLGTPVYGGSNRNPLLQVQENEDLLTSLT